MRETKPRARRRFVAAFTKGDYGVQIVEGDRGYLVQTIGPDGAGGTCLSATGTHARTEQAARRIANREWTEWVLGRKATDPTEGRWL